MFAAFATGSALAVSIGSAAYASVHSDRSLGSSASDPLVRAEAMIDAFYSFDPARLRASMADAPKSQPAILYYQGWAQGGNYKVLDRKPCRLDKPDEISCSIKVKDDLIAALGTGYDVTDTFHLTVDGGRITAVRTSSDDPPQMKQAFDWLLDKNPDLLKAGPCEGFSPADRRRRIAFEESLQAFTISRRKNRKRVSCALPFAVLARRW